MTKSCPERGYFCPYISKYKDSAKLAKKIHWYEFSLCNKNFAIKISLKILQINNKKLKNLSFGNVRVDKHKQDTEYVIAKKIT